MFGGPKLWSLKKNTFSHTYWILAVMGVGKWVVEELGESIKKENWWQFFFPIMKKKLVKSQSADVKQQEIKGLVALSCNFL